MGGRRARTERHDRRQGLRLALVLGLALLSTRPGAQAVPGEPPEIFQRITSAVTSGPAEREQLEALLAEIDALSSPSADAQRARVFAWLALAADSGAAERDEARGEAHRALADMPIDPSLVRATCELANLYMHVGRLAGAEVIAAFGVQELVKHDPTGIPLLWRIRAEAARLGGDWERTDEFYRDMERALAAAPGMNPRDEEWCRATIDLGRAQALLELGLLEVSTRLARSARESAQALKNGELFVTAALFELDLDLMREDYETVLVSVGELRKSEMFHGQESFLVLPEARARIERVRRARLMKEDAGAEARAARELLDQGLRRAGVQRPEQLKMRLAQCELELGVGDAPRAADALRMADALVQEMHTGTRPVLREELLLPTYAWEIARSGGAAPEALDPLRAGVRAAFDQLLVQWQRTPLRPGGIGFLQLSWRAQVVGAAIEAELDSREPDAERRAFEQVLRAQAMGTEARSEREAPDLARIRALLPPGRGAIVLLPSHFRSHLFLVDCARVRHFELQDSRDELRSRARGVTLALGKVSGEPGAEGLKSLSAALLPAEARQLLAQWKEAYALGFDLLGDLPFGELLDGAGKPWGERLPYATLPSLVSALLLTQRPSRGQPDLDLALIAVPEPGEPGPEKLTFGAAERKRLTAPFVHVEVCQGSGATRAAVLRGDWSRARVVHVLAHAKLMADQGSFALLLSASEDGAQCELTPEDVRQLAVGPLVVLSACGTGKGPARIGDDLLVSLGGAFLDAGARCVVLARFPVEYEATLTLMESFSKRVAAGDSPARALQRARAEVAKDAQSSFHAGAFEAIGLGHEPVFAGSR